jgi:hypothetical protein
MTARRLYDRAIFWVTSGGVVAVIGGVLVSVGVTQVGPNGDVWGNEWFRIGIGAVVVGALAVWWALTLYLAHRQAEMHACPDPQAHKLAKPGLDPSTPQVRSVLRQLRSELKEAYRLLDMSLHDGRYWAWTSGTLQVTTWKGNRTNLMRIAGMNAVWDALEDAYGCLDQVVRWRSRQVFGRTPVKEGDDLRGAVASVAKAIEELDAKLRVLDVEA